MSGVKMGMDCLVRYCKMTDYGTIFKVLTQLFVLEDCVDFDSAGHVSLYWIVSSRSGEWTRTRVDGLVWDCGAKGAGWRRAGKPGPEVEGSPGEAGGIQALFWWFCWRHPVR